MLLIITSTGDKLFIAVKVNDLEPSKYRFLVNFSAIFGFDTNFKNATKWLEIDLDILRMTFFSIERTFLRICK